MDKIKKRATIKDIAEHTGFSIATVSRVLNKKGLFYSTKTFEKIQKAIKEMDYHPDAIARGLKTQKTFNIAFLEPWISDFFSEVFLGVQDAANKAGYSVAIFSSNYNKEQEKRNVNTILSNRLDGIIISSAILDRQNLTKIEEQKIPVVAIEKIVDDSLISCITIKNKEISKRAIEYLINLGHKRIGFISEPLDIGNLRYRFKGYKEALSDNSLTLDESIVFIDETFRGQRYLTYYDFTKKNLGKIKSCTALFITSDEAALAVMKALSDEGISVPDDISIIGFDGLDMSKYLIPSITTIVQPRYEMGFKAMELLLDLIDGKNAGRIDLKAELLIGESTAKPKKNKKTR
jgi:DNA-binding LacI/PurR family transcriptional regulator